MKIAAKLTIKGRANDPYACDELRFNLKDAEVTKLEFNKAGDITRYDLDFIISGNQAIKGSYTGVKYTSTAGRSYLYFIGNLKGRDFSKGI